MGRYTKKDAAEETEPSEEETSRAWKQAEEDEGTSGKTLDDVAASPREEMSLEDLKEVEEEGQA